MSDILRDDEAKLDSLYVILDKEFDSVEEALIDLELEVKMLCEHMLKKKDVP